MKLIFSIIFFLLSLCVSAQKIIAITIDGTINPASAGFIAKGIARAQKENAECLVIHLNTPGGLLQSTRVIVRDIFSSPVPIVVYVSPEGAHAGSAGVFLTMSAHIAAMSPGTNIGAAHPVSQQQMDTVMNAKATNDAVAFIRTIAEKRARNVAWAEEAVRNSISITASEAVNQKVIDLVAVSTQQLLIDIDGRTIDLVDGTKTLNTKNAKVEELEMGFMEKLLNIISDPNIAYILLMLGFYGILFELYSPGSVLPGVIGVIALILALYSLNSLPVNYAGLALIIFGVILFLLEIKVTSYGILTIGGLISLILGSFMLIRDDITFPVLQISKTVIITTSVITALFFLFIIGAGIKAQRAKPVTGLEGIIGETGEVINPLLPSGTVLIHGELWNAESISGPMEKGEKTRVTAIKGFTLFVEKI
jgi:membrane-bound serine protease (ClpP class)